MSKRFKWVIVRAKEPGTGAVPDQACFDMVMTGGQSVFTYWEEASDGYFDFLASEMLPWIDVDLTGAVGRVAQADRTFAAVRAQLGRPGHDPLAGFDGAILLIHPGTTLDGGSITTGYWLNTAVIGVMTGNHTFMCHESGHVLGFDHCWGLPSTAPGSGPPTVASSEYGSPYDVMCAFRFGNYPGADPQHYANPAFVGTPVSGWPNPNAHSMGPNISRANLHRWHPEALGGRAAERPFPAAGEVGRVNLRPAGAASGTTLLILHPPGEPASGAGRVYVEYRESRGWDRGLDAVGTDLGRVGVVVHDVADLPGWGPRVWYRGGVANGAADTDLVVAGQPLVITVDRFSAEGGHRLAEVSYRQSAERRVTITPFNQADGVVGGNVVREDRTPCGDTVEFGSWSTLSTCQYRVATTGFTGEPSIGWNVGGTQLAPGNGFIDVPFDDVVFPLEYSIEPGTDDLTLTSRGGERYGADVVANAAESGGGGSASATARFEALGYYDGYTPEDQALVVSCLPPINQPGLDPPRSPMHLRRPPDLRFSDELASWRERALAEIEREPSLDAEARLRLTQLVEMQAPR